MAEEDKSISLIPKEGEKIKIENIFSKIGIVLIVLIILAAGIYGGLFFYNEKLNQQILAIKGQIEELDKNRNPEFCLLYTSPSPRDISGSRMPSSA